MQIQVLVYSAASVSVKLPFGLGFRLKGLNMILIDSTTCPLEFMRNKKTVNKHILVIG